ncbi:FAD/NAD(P)-binding protein [Nevskia sp.]|uniref:FAD/NAD(P)-binding protein n=1 Tax=Nevskia sp. TaxID=1929292 RepID=UPI0025D6CF81|nr:FAD/NAD(P)-binding protein [Nevskia sp.]
MSTSNTDARCPAVAIIGAGFSGTMVAVNLLREATGPLRVILIERADAAGLGVAYREQPDCHLLNVRAEGMSAFPDQPSHFLKWLAEHRGDEALVNPAAFLPRRLYGVYLRSILAEAAATSRRDVRLELVHDEVLGVAASEREIRLRLAKGNPITAQRVVLAMGNPGPADPPADDPSFYSSPLYQSHAWSTHGLISVRHDDAVLLIGSGLTTLDWLAALHERGHRGPIHVVSRRGLLPRAHAVAPRHVLSFDLFAVPPTVRQLMRVIRHEIDTVIAEGGDWRSVMDALRPHGQRLWQRLSRPEQQRFLRHARTYWDIHRHRAAPRIVETVNRLTERGQLEVLAARPVSYADNGDAVEVQLRTRGGKQTITLTVQRVVNCTGPDSNYRRLNHPLLQSLREQGLATVDTLGLGLETDAAGGLVERDGRASARIFTLGPTRKGELWETTAVPEIRGQAQSLARHLLSVIDAAQPSRREPANEPLLAVLHAG